jgi:hypothetical protein
MRGSVYPNAPDVAAMPAYPVIGVAEYGYDVHLGGSILALRAWHPRCNVQAAWVLGDDGPADVPSVHRFLAALGISMAAGAPACHAHINRW